MIAYTAYLTLGESTELAYIHLEATNTEEALAKVMNIIDFSNLQFSHLKERTYI